jgi:hypothetical protein
LPDGRYNTLVFVDSSSLRENRGRPLRSLFQGYLDRSSLLATACEARLVERARAIDATPYVDEESVTPSTIKVGDAALAIDPISSSGVQKAIQTALAGAVVANTLLRRPESRTAAMQFYRTTIAEAAARHRGWAAAQYARVAARTGGRFWETRAAGATPDRPSDAGAPDAADASPLDAVVDLSTLLQFIDLPCIEGEFVTVKAAVHHPVLPEPVAYLGGWELGPLLRSVRGGMTPLEIARSWADRVPLRSGLAITNWLLAHRILVPATSPRISARR